MPIDHDRSSDRRHLRVVEEGKEVTVNQKQLFPPHETAGGIETHSDRMMSAYHINDKTANNFLGLRASLGNAHSTVLHTLHLRPVRGSIVT